MCLPCRIVCRFFLLLGVAQAFCPDDCQAVEKESLQLFYRQTAGSSWRNSTGWVTSGSAQPDPHCKWYGVTCCSEEGGADTGHGTLSCGSPGAVAALVRACGL